VLWGDVIFSTRVVQFDFGRLVINQVVREDALENDLEWPYLEVAESCTENP